ncbi:uncharacterized protein LOC135937039 isoform X1 [Cloeon dipterum]|uniref:uncharacterized protein LOC135937039 isoform X1 n=1 Tax=Cloeon dipterum TaxID=197152 RepID=UPI0032200EA8
MESGGKLELVLLSICLQIFTCDCSYVTYQHRNLNSWEILIGANENEFLYDFCRYDASENIERCKNKPRATVDMRSTCNCTVNYTANAEKGLAYFTVNCNNETLDGLMGGCPQKLSISYEHGDVRHPDKSVESPTTCQMQDKSSRSSLIWILLFWILLLLVINVVFGVFLFKLRNLVSTLKRENKDMSNKMKQTENFNL